jgi:hypothetical protein
MGLLLYDQIGNFVDSFDMGFVDVSSQQQLVLLADGKNGRDDVYEETTVPPARPQCLRNSTE